MGAKEPIPFLTDEDVPDSVGDALRGAGHLVYRAREYLVQGADDPVVAEAASHAGLVLITHNWRDFRQIVGKQSGLTRRQSEYLHRIEMQCGQPKAAERIMAALGLIEHEWTSLQGVPDRAPLWITIGIQTISTKR